VRTGRSCQAWYQIIIPPGCTKERLKVFVARPSQIQQQLPAGYEVTGLERIDGEEHEQGVPHFVHPDPRLDVCFGPHLSVCLSMSGYVQAQMSGRYHDDWSNVERDGCHR
jgi:hypothetical protein